MTMLVITTKEWLCLSWLSFQPVFEPKCNVWLDQNPWQLCDISTSIWKPVRCTSLMPSLFYYFKIFPWITVHESWITRFPKIKDFAHRVSIYCVKSLPVVWIMLTHRLSQSGFWKGFDFFYILDHFRCIIHTNVTIYKWLPMLLTETWHTNDL